MRASHYCCTATLRDKKRYTITYQCIMRKAVPLLPGCTQPAPGPCLRVVSNPPLTLVHLGREPWRARCSPSSPLEAEDKQQQQQQQQFRESATVDRSIDTIVIAAGVMDKCTARTGRRTIVMFVLLLVNLMRLIDCCWT